MAYDPFATMQIRIEYRDSPVRTPVTPWAHRGVDGGYYNSTVFDPPLPNPVHGKGYAVWFVDHRGRSLVFASREEIEHVIDVLDRKILPSSRELGQPYKAVNSHWLSRLHASFKPWKVRQELVKTLRGALGA
ncbi:MAG: hypothetical protein B7Z38_00925 [Rhodobacterales bacterium 12-64-8]|nr:MAG: hypothetical protein B7Z38_00925 [Rhodobacterales bacterium 12-64-8]OYX46718.1 MAG: hypothetical protein B7Y90_14725 [Alphaproteobacteria bacterium 32-64-14]